MYPLNINELYGINAVLRTILLYLFSIDYILLSTKYLDVQSTDLLVAVLEFLDCKRCFIII